MTLVETSIFHLSTNNLEQSSNYLSLNHAKTMQELPDSDSFLQVHTLTLRLSSYPD